MATNPITLPPGYKLDMTPMGAAPKTPAGYTLDAPGNQSGAQQPEKVSESLGITNPILAAPIDAVQGIGAGVMSTLHGASRLAHSAVSAIPEIPESLGTAPDSLAGKIGKGVEQAGEFMLPMGAVGKATKGMSLLQRIAAEGLTSAATAAVQSGGDPAATVGAGVAGAAGPAIGSGVKAGANLLHINPEGLYQSALKPTWSMSKKEGSDLIGTGLREGVPVSSDGLQMVRDKIADLQKSISAGIDSRSKLGATVDTSKVLSRLDDLEDFYRKTAAPEKAVKTLQDLRLQFEQYHGQKLPLDTAQQIKINTYQDLKNSYGEMASAKVEGLKQVARGLKEEISSVFPEVAGMNEQQSKLLGLDDVLYRSLWRIDNHQIMGIGSPLAAGAGSALMGGPGAAVGMAGKFLLDNPELKSKLAIALTQQGVKNAPAIVNLRMAALKAMMAKAGSAAGEATAPSAPIGQFAPGSAR